MLDAVVRSGALSSASLAVAVGCGAARDASSTGSAGADQLLEPDGAGWVDRSSTGSTGIQGLWRGWDVPAPVHVPDGFCDDAPFGECSIVEEPAEGAVYAPTPDLGMCTSGVIARWLVGSDGLTPDGSPGSAGIVLDLAVPDWPERGSGAPAPSGQPYDAISHGVTGFSFHLDSAPAAGTGLSVQLTSLPVAPAGAKAKVATWGGTRLEGSMLRAGHNEFRWDDVAPKSFDPTRLVSIAFLVAGNDSHAVNYEFCIDRLTALRSEAEGPPSPPSVSEGQHLEPDENGWVDRSTTGTTKIQGAWFATSDGDEDGTCRAAGFAASECSAILEPAAGAPFAPTPDLGMCVAGTLAKVVTGSGGPNWDAAWGALLGFTLNEADLPERRSDTYDANRYGVTGFSFELDSEPPLGATIQVQLPTPGTETAAAWWGGDSAAFSPVHAGYNEFRWHEVGGPDWLDDPPPLDASQLTQLRFQVNANESNPMSFRFCVANLTALRD